MSCDRESDASCQDLLAMSRTVRYCTGYTQRLALCQLVLLARRESNQGGNRLRRRPSFARADA